MPRTAAFLATVAVGVVGTGCSRPADEAAKEVARLRADVAELQKKVESFRQEAASADRVSKAFDDFQAQLDALRGGRGRPVEKGDYGVELFVGGGLALRYAGPSHAAAIEKGSNTAGPSAALSRAVKIDPANPRLGTVAFGECYRFGPGSRSGGGEQNLVLAVTRPAADSDAWELAADGREDLKRCRLGVR